MTTRFQRCTGVLFGFALLAGCGRGAPEATELRRVTGFSAPESVYFDDESGFWFVSNVGEQGVPGDGSLSRMSLDGSEVEHGFVAGLDDPKGIRVHAGVLYVSDVDDLVAIPLADPARLERFPVAGAQFLNDVAVDERHGIVYVSDTFGNAIYRLQDGEVSLVLQDPTLEAPNGLVVDGDDLLISTIGPDLDPTTFETSAPGRVLALSLRTLRLTPVSERIGTLDGLERYGKQLLVSDFGLGVYGVERDGSGTRILDNGEQGLGSSADIGLARAARLLAVPDLTSTTVTLYALSWSKQP